MQVEGMRSRIFKDNNRTRENKDRRRKDERDIVLANSERS